MLSATSPSQIRNNPSNNSTSKHQWSFSKAQRFPSPKSLCRKSFYEQRSSLSDRKFSLGIGERSKMFQANNEVPELTSYTLSSQFNNESGKGFKFTLNRNQLKFGNFLKVKQNTPSPSAYIVNIDKLKSSRCYSLKARTEYPSTYFLPSESSVKIIKKRPGPGQYNSIDGFGDRYKTKSSNNEGIAFSRGDRFKTSCASPGPQDYTNSMIKADGIYFLSNMKGSGRRTFLKGNRELKLADNKNTPGPGSYRIPSDFGHYQEFRNESSKTKSQSIKKQSTQKGRPSTAMS